MLGGKQSCQAGAFAGGRSAYLSARSLERADGEEAKGRTEPEARVMSEAPELIEQLLAEPDLDPMSGPHISLNAHRPSRSGVVQPTFDVQTTLSQRRLDKRDQTPLPRRRADDGQTTIRRRARSSVLGITHRRRTPMPTSPAFAVQPELCDDLGVPGTTRRLRVFKLCREERLALAAAVKAYRAGCRSSWAPVVLTMMAPAVEGRLRDLYPVPPAISSDDIRQQLLVEVLEAALCIPLPQDPLMFGPAILSRASQAVSRRLGRELRRQERQDHSVEEES